MRRCLPLVVFVFACSSEQTSAPTGPGNVKPTDTGGETLAPPVTDVPAAGETVQPQDGTTGGGEDTVVPIEEGEFGWPCKSNKDCDSGFCVGSDHGPVCTKTCLDDCPEGWLCKEVANLGSDTTFVCTSGSTGLCRPCSADVDCAGGAIDSPNKCLPFGTEGSFCGTDCADGKACPDGYTCTSIPQANGASADQCVPIAGTCPCLEQYDGLTTPCINEAAAAKCVGQRTCDGATLTWSPCDADTPSAEVCDGEDNDCSGQKDDNLVPEPCKSENDAGVCLGKTTCTDGLSGCDAKTPTTEFCDLVDNDCDGLTDEDLENTTCGLGECVHEAGSCVNGKPAQCDPLAGAIPEACNGKDDDCNGTTDDLDALGQTTCGLGICKHTVANCQNGAPTLCQPYEGQQGEVCDGLDNDCNGLTDELWLDKKGLACDGPDLDKCATGKWTCKEDGSDVICGGDDVVTLELCNGADDDCNGAPDDGLGQTTCGLGACLHTVENCLGGQTQTCDAMQGAQGSDEPDPSFQDVDCDGIDGTKALAVFVDGSKGNDGNSGAIDSPVKSIQKGIQVAKDKGKPHVYVSQGSYGGKITLQNGISVFGGYNATSGWARGAANTAQVSGDTTMVVASGISSPTILDRLTITANSNPSSGGSSYGLLLVNAGGLTVRDCVVTAGKGGGGDSGQDGNTGQTGDGGKPGNSGCENGGCKISFCSNCSAPSAGAGGSGPCSSTSGGNGGKSGNGTDGGATGGSGSGGAPGGSGGSAGNNGSPGSAGGGGGGGSNGSGGANIGALGQGGYSPANGESGGDGTSGAGGGGGGGGGGDNACGDWYDSECKSYGGTGGGGGAGGCGGKKGAGGGGGGGSFAVYVYGGNPTLVGCTLHAQDGGPGGSGGNGGPGGNGGTAGAGGTGGDEDSKSGGAGGKGGKGGDGGDGGGGGGGPSIGVACAGGAKPSLQSNTVSSGKGGAAGSSASSDGKSGKTAQTYGCL